MLASVRSVHAAVDTKVQMWRLNTEAEERTERITSCLQPARL